MQIPHQSDVCCQYTCHTAAWRNANPILKFLMLAGFWARIGQLPRDGDSVVDRRAALCGVELMVLTWLRLGCVGLQRIAAFCIPRTRNLQ